VYQTSVPFQQQDHPDPNILQENVFMSTNNGMMQIKRLGGYLLIESGNNFTNILGDNEQSSQKYKVMIFNQMAASQPAQETSPESFSDGDLISPSCSP